MTPQHPAITPELIHAEVLRSRAAQGLPPKVQDPAVLERVAAVLRLADPAVESLATSPRKRPRKTAAVQT